MKTPLIALNLKTYAESTGASAEKLVSIAKEVAEKSKKQIIVCPQNTDLLYFCKKFPQSQFFRIYGQHFDSNKQGAFTGSITVEAIKATGCAGSLLNHSEKKIGIENVEKCIARAKESGIEVIACADSVEEAKKIAKFSPLCIAVEPPELIGSGISVTSAKPGIVSDSVKEIKKISPKTIVLVGAGVSNAADVKKSIELGAEGVLLASAYAKSANPKKLLEEMAAVL